MTLRIVSRSFVTAAILSSVLWPMFVLAQARFTRPPPPQVGPLAPYADSWAEYEDLKTKAHGGTKVTWATLPDWSGLWSRVFGIGFNFDPSQKTQFGATASLTPEYQQRFDKKLADYKKGIEWDPLSSCLPVGYPRWLAEPFLKEFILRPEEAWLVNEQEAEIRRIYTDGRPHIRDEDAYPVWEGDSIGFWSGDTLVIHTNHVKHGQFMRQQPDYSDELTTVEQWRQVAPGLIQDIVDIYDPVALTKPWRVVQQYTKDRTPDLRMNHWSCEENNNVVKEPDGSTKFQLPGEKGYKDPNTLGDTSPQTTAPK
jgi:hypothetical protein